MAKNHYAKPHSMSFISKTCHAQTVPGGTPSRLQIAGLPAVQFMVKKVRLFDFMKRRTTKHFY
jgi:hypothetical protein